MTSKEKMNEGDRVNMIVVTKDGETIKRSGEIVAINEDTARVRWNTLGASPKRHEAMETVEWLKNLS